MTNRTFLSILVAMVIALALPVGASAIEVEVPNVVGLSVDDAIDEILASALRPGTIGYEFSETVDSGLVARQDPTAGKTVEIGTTVQFWVSLGPAKIPVPLVVGQDLAAAKSEIEAAGLEVGQITEEYNEAPESTVIQQEPSAGTVVGLATPVDLVVSLGPEPVLVPNVVGDLLADAVEKIVSATLTVGEVKSEWNETVAAGNVISQKPEGGTSVDVGSAIDLVVSKGPEQWFVPYVEGMLQADAETAIVDAGLTVGEVTNDNSDTIEVGRVISQSPEGGTSVEEGSAVDLVISLGPSPKAVPVATEGDTLLDGSVLQTIYLAGGVAINLSGNVAFGGRDEDGTDAAFTQAGKVVAEGDTLPDDTVLAAFREQGEVAISAYQSGDRLAFHGTDDLGTATVFTQAGKVAQVGDPLAADTTLYDINPAGKVAVNGLDQVAFHGKIINIQPGEADGETLRAVFTSNGETTQVAAQEGSDLPDDTTLEQIIEGGGVAISDFDDEVAFHGKTGGVDAVFTSERLVAKEGGTLEDNTVLDDINYVGGVAINYRGQVAFHGKADGVKAVFTQAGLVAKEGDTLPDGTPLEEINLSGGVAINIFGDVVFHGRTRGFKAVFTQAGLVAKEGDLLTDGTTLKDISDTAGVAINPYGQEVAFHGVISVEDPRAGADAVLVGQVPVAE